MILYHLNQGCQYVVDDDLNECGVQSAWLYVDDEQGITTCLCDPHLAATLADIQGVTDGGTAIKVESVHP